MSSRPAVPAEIRRQILFESGYCCAVCGRQLPLELAHIVPWRHAKEHNAEDMICLCANCHERADHEEWGEKTLREFKEKPWVLRQPEEPESNPSPAARVQLTATLSVENFDQDYARLLRYALAAFLKIEPEVIRIESVEKGSVKVTIELPEESAERLLNAFETKDSELLKYVGLLGIVQLFQELAGPREVRTAICHHVTRDAVQHFMALLEARGHSVEHFNQEEPQRAHAAVKRFRPHVVYTDLYFEKKDSDKPPQEWWGCRIIHFLRTDADTRDIPVVVESKYLYPEVMGVLDTLGVPEARRTQKLRRSLKDVAQLLESCL